MNKRLFLNLRLFGEGGDGGDAGEGAGESTGVEIPASIPEKARGAYKKALEKNATKPQATTEAETVSEAVTKPSYADLIKSDDYKAEHEAYMKDTINQRFKKYKGIEEESSKMKSVLETIGTKYGLDANAEGFLDAITAKVSEDNSYFESYAMEHDISVEDARKNLTLERRVKEYEAKEKERLQQEQMQSEWNNILQRAEKTKQMYPEFDLNIAMNDENFARICKVTGGDTTAAYLATNWNSVIPRQVQMATQVATQQIANSVKANKSRPIEAGISSSATAITTPSFKGMKAADMKAYAQTYLRK